MEPPKFVLLFSKLNYVAAYPDTKPVFKNDCNFGIRRFLQNVY